MSRRTPPIALLGRRFRWSRPRVYLHIGAMKTGTTYLQGLMTANQDQLARAGVLFPGERWSDQSAAAADVLGFKIKDPDRRDKVAGTWQAMAQQMLAWKGKASVYSMEFLSFADEEQAARIVDSLDGAEVHVILTVRDAAAAIPAQWQTICRTGGTVPFRRFVYGVRRALESDSPGKSGKSKPVRMFLRTQGITRMLDVWVPLVGASRVHVVTVPPKGADPDLLWKRVATVIGVRPKVATVPVSSSNTSLGHTSTELLRRVNRSLGPLTRVEYSSVVKSSLARKILGSRAGEEKPIRLHRRGRAFAARWNRLVRQAILDTGVDVVGDLGDLPVDRPPASVPRHLVRPKPEELLAAAETATTGLLALEREHAEEVSGLGGTPRRASLPAGAEDASDPVDLAVADIVALVHSCVDLKKEARRLRGARKNGMVAPETSGRAG